MFLEHHHPCNRELSHSVSKRTNVHSRTPCVGGDVVDEHLRTVDDAERVEVGPVRVRHLLRHGNARRARKDALLLHGHFEELCAEHLELGDGERARELLFDGHALAGARSDAREGELHELVRELARAARARGAHSELAVLRAQVRQTRVWSPGSLSSGVVAASGRRLRFGERSAEVANLRVAAFGAADDGAVELREPPHARHDFVARLWSRGDGVARQPRLLERRKAVERVHARPPFNGVVREEQHPQRRKLAFRRRRRHGREAVPIEVEPCEARELCEPRHRRPFPESVPFEVERLALGQARAVRARASQILQTGVRQRELLELGRRGAHRLHLLPLESAAVEDERLERGERGRFGRGVEARPRLREVEHAQGGELPPESRNLAPVRDESPGQVELRRSRRGSRNRAWVSRSSDESVWKVHAIARRRELLELGDSLILPAKLHLHAPPARALDVRSP
mmetsp:Transcript_22754/g.74075  ORF Transcript_22754/g.74075 Transcript_22754/m.74075 type:complete len:458 (+) Transcript_22754:167-1540(+)